MSLIEKITQDCKINRNSLNEAIELLIKDENYSELEYYGNDETSVALKVLNRQSNLMIVLKITQPGKNSGSKKF